MYECTQCALNIGNCVQCMCVQCTVYSVQCTVYSVQCTVFRVQCMYECTPCPLNCAHWKLFSKVKLQLCDLIPNISRYLPRIQKSAKSDQKLKRKKARSKSEENWLYSPCRWLVDVNTNFASLYTLYITHCIIHCMIYSE